MLAKYFIALFSFVVRPSSTSELKDTIFPYVHVPKVCYPDVGCFDTEAPYSYVPWRPMAPPEDPAVMKPYVRYIPDGNAINNFHEISLIGAFNTSAMSHLGKFGGLRNSEMVIFVIGCDVEHNMDMSMKLAGKLQVGTNSEVSSFVFGVHHFYKNQRPRYYSNMRSIGVSLARFIKHLQVEYDIYPAQKVWLLGRGCGGHMAGYVGERVLVSRITAFDPTGFMFEGEDNYVKLDRSDALYVDVIHTHSEPTVFKKGVGIIGGHMQPIGHVDFYVNGGYRQPACAHVPGTGGCKNFYAVDYFIASLPTWAKCKMWGYPVSMDNYIQAVSNNQLATGLRRDLKTLRNSCNMTKCVPMGFDAIQSPLRGIMVVTNNGMPCSSTNAVLDVKSTKDWFYEGAIKFLRSFIPGHYHALKVQTLPSIPPVCFPYNYLGCFNMTPPWTILKSRPISPPEGPQLQRVEAWLYTRQSNNKYTISLHPAIPVKDVEDSPFDARRMTFLLIHGFYNSGNEPWLGEMKEALIQKTDANVFICNWGGGSVTLDYLQAAGNLRLVSRVYSNLLQFMIDHHGLNTTRVHLIGHSLGAHIAGLVGKSIPGIFQITALDPAQPWFQGADNSVRVTKDDANFVMGVHSDISPFIPDLGFGLAKEVGHIDFYINGGFKQPKCSHPHNIDMMKAPNFTNIIDLLKPLSQLFVAIVLCPHQTAVDVFTQAIVSRQCVFWGQTVSMANMIAASMMYEGSQLNAIEFKALTDVPCTVRTCSPMGLDTYFWPARGTFVIITKDFPPYCIYEKHVEAIQNFPFKVQPYNWDSQNEQTFWIHSLQQKPFQLIRLTLFLFIGYGLVLLFNSYALKVLKVVYNLLPIQAPATEAKSYTGFENYVLLKHLFN